MQVVVDSLLTSYVAKGRGKTLVLLHGWGDSSAGLLGLQGELAKKYRVISVDLPGFGASQVPNEIWGLENYAQFVADFLQKIDEKNIYAFVGHSNGGAVALSGIAHGVLRAEKLVLLASAGIRAGDSARKLGFKIFAKTGKVAVAWLPASQRKKLRARLYKTAGSDMLVVPELQETFKKTVTADVQDNAAKLHLPTLLIYGENDRETPTAYGQRFHELILGSRFEVLPGAGHFVHLDQPEKTLKLVEDFLK